MVSIEKQNIVDLPTTVAKHLVTTRWQHGGTKTLTLCCHLVILAAQIW